MPTHDATVLVVDDDPPVRRGVSRLVRAAGFSVKTFGSPQEFLRYELPQGPACVVLDMCMDGLTGIDVQNALHERPRHIPIVFLSGHGTIPTATTTIKHGAEDFLEKPFRPKELIAAIRRAIEHDRSQSADRSDREELERRYNTLTPREQEVMRLVVSGLLNKQSAAELGISEKTIKVHRARVMEKMQVESLADLVRLAERMGIAAPAPSPAPAKPESLCSTAHH
jgi:RNA polymerase sigma factor (sigma-70 family)